MYIHIYIYIYYLKISQNIKPTTRNSKFNYKLYFICKSSEPCINLTPKTFKTFPPSNIFSFK